MNLIFTLIVFSVPLVWTGLVIWDYAKATGTVWERLYSAFRDSASLLWARLNGVAIWLTGVVGDASGWLGAPGVQDTVAPWISAKALLVYALVVVIGAELARRRTLKKEGE